MTVLMNDDKSMEQPWYNNNNKNKNKSYLNCELVALHHILIGASCMEVAL